MKKFDRILLIAITAGFILSLVPVLYVCRYDFASGDDYAFGAAAHLAYINTHSLWAAVCASARHTADIYYSWQGTWLSVFLFGLQPEVFGERLYAIVPWIMVFLTIFSIGYAGHHLFREILGMDRVHGIIVTMMIALVFIHFIPTKSNAYFWYNGAVHYTVAYALMLFALTDASVFIRNGRLSALIRLSIYATALGGMSYLAPLALIVGTCAAYIYTAFICRRGCKRRDLFLLIPFALECAGLIISAMAPGNAVRGGEGFGFSVTGALVTVVKSFVSGFEHAAGFVKEEPFTVIVFAAVVLCFVFSDCASKHEFSHPLAAVILLLGWNACVYAPEIYSNVEVSDGVNNTYFCSFVITACLILIYLAGYVRSRSKSAAKRSLAVYAALWAVIAVLCVVCRHSLSDTSFKVCYDFIRKGYGEDLREQMLLQQELLGTDERNVIIPSTNGYGGPIMNMPVTESPDAWTNEVTARFYGKESVTGMDADAWHAKYDNVT